MRSDAPAAEDRGTPDHGASALYDTDFHAWSLRQAETLRAAARAGSDLPLDFEHLAEEVEDLGNRLRDELLSRLETIVEHLLKLQFSPATDPRAGRRSAVLRSRIKVARLLKQNPSLRRAVPELLAEARQIAEPVAVDLEGYGEIEAAAAVRRAGGAYSAAPTRRSRSPATGFPARRAASAGARRYASTGTRTSVTQPCGSLLRPYWMPVMVS